MSNIKEQIRQEIDTRRQHIVEELMGHEENCEYHRIKGMHDAYVDLLTFLDYSLPEEKPSEDLEEEVKRYYSDNFTYISSDQPTLSILTNVARHFAEWQKEQLMDEWLKDRDGCFWDGVNEGKKAMEEQMMKDSEEDALLLERAWLTLDGFGHEELAGRLRQFAERKGLIWK